MKEGKTRKRGVGTPPSRPRPPDPTPVPRDESPLLRKTRLTLAELDGGGRFNDRQLLRFIELSDATASSELATSVLGIVRSELIRRVNR